MISLRTVVKAAEGQIFCDLAGEIALLDLKSGKYFGLNEVGAFIYHLIQTPKPFSEIRDTLLQEYQVDALDCERDLRQILGVMLDKGLINVEGNGDVM